MNESPTVSRNSDFSIKFSSYIPRLYTHPNIKNSYTFFLNNILTLYLCCCFYLFHMKKGVPC